MKLWLWICSEPDEWHNPVVRVYTDETHANEDFVDTVREQLRRANEDDLERLMEHADPDLAYAMAKLWINNETDEQEPEIREVEVPEPEPVI